MQNEHGALIVLSGPSGVGKGTVLDELEKLGITFLRSVSATTRGPREGEKDGVSYYFLKREQFQKMLDEDAFLEHAEYAGECYGTPEAPVNQTLAENKNVLLEIDVQGAMQVRKKRPDAVLVFLLPPSMEELERRLRDRGTETEEKIVKRLSAAGKECALSCEYDYRIVNDDKERAAAELAEIVRNARIR